MKSLRFILGLLLVLALSVQLSFAQKPLPDIPVKGFNLGQLFEFAHRTWGQDGFVPQWAIDSMKARVPEDMQRVCRMSGTVSNYWAPDLPGFNFYTLINFRERNNIPHPKQSYFYAFIDFYKRWGFEELVWTLNTHQSYISPLEADFWDGQMMKALHILKDEGINVSYICTENEYWLDFRLVGISGGAPNVGEKVKYGGLFGAFRGAASFEPDVKADIRRFLSHLATRVKMAKTIFPEAMVLQSVDNADDHLRGRWVLDVTREFNFYDAICPHIYIRTDSPRQLEADLLKRLNEYGNTPLFITEGGYNYELQDRIDNLHPYVANHFFADYMNIASKHRHVNMMMWHTLWLGNTLFGVVRDIDLSRPFTDTPPDEVPPIIRAPKDIVIRRASITAITVSWDDTGAEYYNARQGNAQANVWNTKRVNGTQTNFSGTLFRTFDIQIQAVYPGGVHSEWSDIISHRY